MKVEFLDFKKLYTAYQEEIDAAIKCNLLTGKLILQEEVDRFEERLAKYLGVKYCVGLNSGTDALMLALAAAGVGPGDEVITVSHTFIATIQVIHHLGATPVLVDVGEDGLMDIPKAARATTDKTKAIIPVHLTGDAVKEFDSQGIPIIEDAAQAIGAKGVGYGDMQCYSFYPAKILGTYGDAGALTTNSDTVYERVKSLRNHGGVTKYDQESYEYGWNSRLDNIWAATLNVKLDYLSIDIKKREEIAKIYLESLKGLVLLPPNTEGRVWQDFVIRVKDPQALAAYLEINGIETLGAGMLPNHKHPGLGLDHFNLPITDLITEQQLRLPCNHFMTEEDAIYVAGKIRQYYEL